MAGVTERIRPVLLHSLAHRKNLPIGAGRLQLRNHRRRGRRRGTKDVIQDPLTTKNRGGDVGVRRHHLDTALAEKTRTVLSPSGNRIGAGIALSNWLNCSHWVAKF